MDTNDFMTSTEKRLLLHARLLMGNAANQHDMADDWNGPLITVKAANTPSFGS